MHEKTDHANFCATHGYSDLVKMIVWASTNNLLNNLCFKRSNCSFKSSYRTLVNEAQIDYAHLKKTRSFTVLPEIVSCFDFTLKMYFFLKFFLKIIEILMSSLNLNYIRPVACMCAASIFHKLCFFSVF